MTLKEKILYCLEHYPETRNSDITLTIKIWEEFTNNLIWSKKRNKYYVAVEDLFDMPREDNIKRWRAKIQNEMGIYLPTDKEVLAKRGQLEKEWRQQMKIG